jgi:hypothetical protein
LLGSGEEDDEVGRSHFVILPCMPLREGIFVGIGLVVDDVVPVN